MITSKDRVLDYVFYYCNSIYNYIWRLIILLKCFRSSQNPIVNFIRANYILYLTNNHTCIICTQNTYTLYNILCFLYIFFYILLGKRRNEKSFFLFFSKTVTFIVQPSTFLLYNSHIVTK